jgi:hypothetical protein
LLVAAAAVIAACSYGDRGSSGPERALSTGPAPWPSPADAKYWIEQAGLEALPAEHLEYHMHAHLRVYVDGVAMPVPAFIGIDRREQLISPLHTHDATGIIHVESAAPARFTLGQLFTEWAVRLDASCVGGYCRPTTPIAVYVAGQAADGSPEDIELLDRRAIVIVIGTPPPAIPSSFDFPAGL